VANRGHWSRPVLKGLLKFVTYAIYLKKKSFKNLLLTRLEIPSTRNTNEYKMFIQVPMLHTRDAKTKTMAPLSGAHKIKLTDS
jgi:hypothetical protein